MSEANKLNLNDLNKANGGADPRPSGMPCPACNHFIPLTMEQILIADFFQCPHCGLRLKNNHQETSAALATLRKWKELQNKIGN